MSAPAVLCAAAEIALNRYLRLEPAVIEECATLSGKCLEFVLPAASMTLVVEFMPTGVRVMPQSPQAPNLRVSGSSTALVGALRHVAGSKPGIPAGLQIEGDAELLERFRAMVGRVGFDPEEWLAPLLGGVAAHRLVGGLKRMFDWTQGNTRRVADHTAEYLREETYDLARARDVGEWINEVEDARESLDRLEARLRLLEGGATSTARPD